MTEEQVKKGQELVELIRKYKNYLERWYNATECANAISVKSNGYSKQAQLIIPFNELKARHVAYYQSKVEEVQKELSKL